MVILATDAPVSPRNLERMAARAVLGLARTGSFMHNGSGDFVVAFSTAEKIPHGSPQRVRESRTLRNDAMSPLFLAVVEAVEEAVLNSLLRATTVTGHGGRTRNAFPLDTLRAMIAAREDWRAGRPRDLYERRSPRP
jgi:D-aminopeptidase